VARVLILVALEDSRIEKLHSLIAEAVKMRETAERLIADLNEQLHLTVSTADDRGVRHDRRKKPRD
jgi:uncharacterized protein YaaQ